MVKHLVIGSYGMVGSAIVKQLEMRRQYVYRFSPHFRIENRQQVLAATEYIEPEYIWLCAGYTNVTKAETDPQGDLVNIDGVRNVCEAAQQMGSKLVFFSSSYIFDGSYYKPYDIGHQPNPISMYGLQKVVGERIVSLVDNHTIIRTCSVYGHDVNRKCFPYKVIDTLKSGKILYAPMDEIICPINVKHLTSISITASREYSGIYHINGDMPLTKFEWAKDIASAFGLRQDRIFATTGDKIRPKNGTLKNSFLVPSYVRGMREFIDDYEAANN